MKQRAALWVLAAALLLGVLARWPLLENPGLWVDEVFSLAIATGHSLEHPASDAVPRMGDFIEGARPLPAYAWRAYCEHGDSPAGLERVLRARSEERRVGEGGGDAGEGRTRRLSTS